MAASCPKSDNTDPEYECTQGCGRDDCCGALSKAQASCKFGLSPFDPSSYSRPDKVLVASFHLQLEVDFQNRVFSGYADLFLEKKYEIVKQVVLDAKDLKIISVRETKIDIDLEYELLPPVKEFGSKLTIFLPYKEADPTYTVRVTYATDPSASGLLWMNAEQTMDKKNPYVFSEFESISARSFFPCQDSPSAKSTYTAAITVPSGLTAVMSAKSTGKTSKSGKTEYTFEQPIAIPSYLVAIVVGSIVSKSVSSRCIVWAENGLISKAAEEFSDVEKQLATAEELCGPYIWGEYGILVLPPMFPYGGMENPCLTFVTPTIISGDKSLTYVVAHEIAHSWSGNSVSCATFEHFWLNEGLTVFLERRIIGKMKGSEMEDFHAIMGLRDLSSLVEKTAEGDKSTCLVADLKETHPDYAFSIVPYEKGYVFLRYLESVVGGPEIFEPFFPQYFEKFKMQSIESDDFVAFFKEIYGGVKEIDIEQVDWDTWLRAPGMPPVIPEYDKTLSEACVNIIGKILGDFRFEEGEADTITPEQRIYILGELLAGDPLDADKLQQLNEFFQLDATSNAEQKFFWLRLCIKGRLEEKIPIALNWISEVGRMKYVRPIYKDLFSWDVSQEQAIKNFEANKSKMMTVAVMRVSADLKQVLDDVRQVKEDVDKEEG